MKEYHKINTIFKRDMVNKGRLILGDWSEPEFEMLKDIKWNCTEKIDGTNIRIIWDGWDVTFKGRTDRADIPKHLLSFLKEKFTNDMMQGIFGELTAGTTATIYGEGYGKKIQKGGNYIPNGVSFIMFDIKIGNWWLTRASIDDIASSSNIEIVPLLGLMTLQDAINMVTKGFKSTIAANKEYMAEGLVCKPEFELFNRSGKRIVAKIKHVDFIKR